VRHLIVRREGGSTVPEQSLLIYERGSKGLMPGTGVKDEMAIVMEVISTT
jgi:hypothetical protein